MIEKTTLENGIRIVTENVPAVHSVTIGIWVESGSRHEHQAQGGISHFVEHLLFKGTSRRSALEIAREIDSVGGVLNAFTSREYCCFYAKVLARHLPLAIDLLADSLQSSIFDLDEIEKERRVILQEISMVEDTPDDLVHDLFSQTFWGNHPLGRPVLGSRESVKNMSRDDFLAHLEGFLVGGNILVCAAGDLNHDHVVDRIARVFGQMAAGARKQVHSHPDYRPSLSFTRRDLEQVHICLGTRALPQNHPNRFSAYILNTILGGSMSSRLFQTIREEQGLAYSIYSYLNSHSDAGALVLYTATSTENAPLVVRMMLKEMQRFKVEPVSRAELKAAKDQLKGHLLLSLESTDNRMTRLSKNEIYLGRQPSLKQVLGEFEKVTAESIQRLAHFLFQDDYLNLQLLGQIEEKQFPLLDLTLG
ncbi:insulinase family protein [Desulfuromonas sp. KJ2020]|uniref:M16 family metallopeptidase n=1 Tax=Desulfuromonas sp. KJ2020 TaxID=2919173 RepID=UPI0020A7CAE1|nr:pitrilysin family protein [Desulfuromonas sp. KJ2020]MCP3178106.1 insulinase family protein [Desulfuromonas sp. KJ2020]